MLIFLSKLITDIYLIKCFPGRFFFYNIYLPDAEQQTNSVNIFRLIAHCLLPKVCLTTTDTSWIPHGEARVFLGYVVYYK